MPRYSLIVAYDGTDFHGWQKQAPQPSLDPDAEGDDEPLRTIQGVLERAVQIAVHEPISLVGAGRTDSGVHAIGQVAAFTSTTEMDTKRLVAAINSRLPPDIQVRRAAVAAPTFSPISDAIAKGYRFRIVSGTNGPSRRPLFSRRTTFFTPYALDCAPMNLAARCLIGCHDFASFTRKHHGRESTVRTIHDCQVTQTARRRCHIDVSGDGFLHNMVRIIAGTLVEVGRGRTKPESLEAILQARDRAAAGPTLPPEGLCLMWVRYEEGTDRPTD